MALATSTSAKALQRSSADKCVYLYDGSLLVAYWNGTAGQVAQVTSPLTSPSVTNLITTAEDGVSLWADNSSGTSSYTWVASSYDDASGSGPALHVRSGTYTSGGGFSWNTATAVPGTTTSATIQCSVTWNGTYLMVFLWDGASGTDRLSYAYTADKTGQSGWTSERTLNGGAWSTITQVAARHSARLGATVIAYGGNSRMFYGALPDGTLGQATGATASETGSWSGTATTSVAAGIIAAVKPSGASPVLACGSTAQVRAVAGSVTAAWGNGQQRAAGNLLVAVVSATGTTSAATISTPSGWTQQVTVGGATAATCALYTKTAAGADAAPAFTSTISGTATMTVQLLELVNAATTSPLDTSGTSTGSGTVASLALTTSGNVTNAGDYLLSVFTRERAAGTTTYSAGSGWLNVVNDGATSSTGHCSLDVRGAGPELNNWAGNGATGFYSFTDNYTNFGGPQLVIDEATGGIHCVRAMTTGGGPTNSGICYWHGTYSAGTVTWSSVLVVDADGGAATPADIGAAVDTAGALYVTYTDAVTAGNLKYAKIASPFTSVASGPTVIVAGSGSVSARWPHSPPVSPSMAGLGTALPVLYANTFSSPYPVLLDTSVTLPGVVPGTASLSGTGTIAAAAPVQFTSAAALSGSGALTAPRSVRFPGAALLSGTGSLAAGEMVALASAAALSGSGSLAAAGAVTQPAAAALTGSGSLTAAPAVQFTSAAVLSGSGSLTGGAVVAQPASAALSGSGAMTAARLVTQPAAAVLTGTGALAAVPAVQFAESAVLAGSGALSAPAVVTQPAASSLSGSGTLTAAETVQFTSASTLAGSGSLGASALVQFTSGAVLAGTGTLTSAALVAQPASAALSGSGSITAVAAVKFTASAALSGSGTLTAAALVTQPAAAVLTGSGSLTAVASVQFTSVAALSGTGTLTAAGTVSGLASGAAALSGSGALTAGASPVLAVGAALSGAGSLTDAVSVRFTSSAVLAGLGSLTTAALVTQPAGAVLSGAGSLTAGASPVLLQAAALAGSGIVAAAALVTVPGGVSLSGAGLLTAQATVTLPASASLAGQGMTAAAVTVSAPSGVTLSGAGSLTAGPSLLIAAASVLAGAGFITVSVQVVTPGTGFTGTVTWTARAGPPRWHARPAAPRWHAQAAPGRWQAAETPPRWQVRASSSRWRIAMGNFAPVAAISLEMINVTWTSELAGTSVDPTGATTGEAALPVQMAFPVSSGNPAAPAEPSSWFAASWLLGGTSIGYTAQCLVGPGGGVVTLTAGLTVDVWSKILGSPEVPARFAGSLAVY